MSDYIPTTADVRDAYSSESTDSTYANRMFDLWLARYKAKIVAKTEERIIKLLEDNLDFGFDVGICDKEGNCQLSPSDLIALIKGADLIALIKGENK